MLNKSIAARVLFYEVVIKHLQRDWCWKGIDPSSPHAIECHWCDPFLHSQDREELLSKLWNEHPIQSLQHLRWMCERIPELYFQNEVEHAFYYLEIVRGWVKIVSDDKRLNSHPSKKNLLRQNRESQQSCGSFMYV